MNKVFFDNAAKAKAEYIKHNRYSQFSNLESFELKNLAVVWCYYSGRIEGNTYSLVETEALIKDDITASKTYSETKMIKNLYNTFISIVEMVKHNERVKIDEFFVKTVHSSLTDELLKTDYRGKFRDMPVQIVGTEYKPPIDRDTVARIFDTILDEQYLYENPLERAIFLHCNIARLQPFHDGNKRTARTLESTVLMSSNIVPVYSSRPEDTLKYREAIIDFYETENYEKYINFFLDKQIERLNAMSRPEEQFHSK